MSLIFISHEDFILFLSDEVSIYAHEVIEIHGTFPWLPIEFDQSLKNLKAVQCWHHWQQRYERVQNQLLGEK